MIIYPAMDLSDGACVRLRQGDFDAMTTYSRSPVEQARGFERAGAAWLHIVDLDGARDGALAQTDLILDIARATSLELQVGGGIRNEAQIETLLSGGVRRVVVGSTAAEAPERAGDWLKQFGAARTCLAFDVRVRRGVPVPATHGWTVTHDATLWELLTVYRTSSARNVMVTDIDRDGMLVGPNVELYDAIGERFPEMDVVASGGISSLADIEALARLPVAGAIVGRALYDERFTLQEALRC